MLNCYLCDKIELALCGCCGEPTCRDHAEDYVGDVWCRPCRQDPKSYEEEGEEE